MITLKAQSFKGNGIQAPGTVVLRDKGESSLHRYVTHRRNDQVGGYYHGHYFDSYADAFEDYTARCAREETRVGKL